MAKNSKTFASDTGDGNERDARLKNNIDKKLERKLNVISL